MKINFDGTVSLYHGTTKEAAKEIIRTLVLKSAAESNVYVTTSPNGTGYGDGTVVKVDVNPKDLTLDDEFPSGRKDYSLPEKIYKVRKAEIVGSFKEWIK
jgi:hypothetical protein